ncbi:MAG: hypothetical protein IPP94_13155 [Ignavibacteria bacterium]|nr:hypothetical protein [Ignavibacteria bacterium]
MYASRSARSITSPTRALTITTSAVSCARDAAEKATKIPARTNNTRRGTTCSG